MSPIEGVPIGELQNLTGKWESRCFQLANQRKFWEAGRLHEAVRELQAVIDAQQAKNVDRVSHLVMESRRNVGGVQSASAERSYNTAQGGRAIVSADPYSA